MQRSVKVLLTSFSLVFFISPLYALIVDQELMNFLMDGAESTEEARARLQAVCREEEALIKSEYNKEKRKISRRLDSLDRSNVSQRDDMNRSRKRLAKELDTIDDQCRRAERTIEKQFARREKVKKPPTLQKPVLKKTVSPPPVAVKKQAPRAESVWADNLRIQGTLKQETALRADKPRVLTKNRSQLVLEEAILFGGGFKLKSSQRAFFDSVAYDNNNEIPEGSTTTEKNDLESEIQLRELYLDGAIGEFDFRLGKQHIVWGEALALFVADTVNGKDLREYILPDFDWIRRTQWSVDVIHTKDLLTSEFVVSLPEFHKLGTRGSEFEVRAPVPAGVVLPDPDKPDVSLSNADIGYRGAFIIGGLDLGAFFLRTWDKFPVIQRRVSFTGVSYSAEYKRQNVLGVTFSKDINESILKGEFIIKPGQSFATADPLDFDGVDKKMVFDYALGVDRTLFGRFDTNVQILQRLIPNGAEFLINEEATRTHFSLWLKVDLFGDKVTPEVLALISPNRKDHLFRPKITFKMSDSVLWRLGGDFFEGKPAEGLFGIFEGKSRAYSEVEYHF